MQLLQLKEENYCLDDHCKCQEQGWFQVFYMFTGHKILYLFWSGPADNEYIANHAGWLSIFSGEGHCQFLLGHSGVFGMSLALLFLCTLYLWTLMCLL